MGENAAKLGNIASDILRLAQELPNGILRSAAVEAAIILSDAAVPCLCSRLCQQSLSSIPASTLVLAAPEATENGSSVRCVSRPFRHTPMDIGNCNGSLQ